MQEEILLWLQTSTMYPMFSVLQHRLHYGVIQAISVPWSQSNAHFSKQLKLPPLHTNKPIIILNLDILLYFAMGITNLVECASFPYVGWPIKLRVIRLKFAKVQFSFRSEYRHFETEKSYRKAGRQTRKY